MKGTVKWFSKDKGYGFITSEADDDHYFSVRNVKGVELPSNGDSVEFESTPGSKGPRAANISIMTKAVKQSFQRVDDRVDCRNCGKRMVPRIITDKGALDRSVCPFCGSMFEDFDVFRNFLSWMVKIVIKYPIPTIILVVILYFFIDW